MSNQMTISEIKRRHEEVYEKLLDDPSLGKSGDKRDEFLAKEVDPLIEDMKAVSTTDMSFQDYTWLSDTALHWQVLFSSIFNIPRKIEIATPPQLYSPTIVYTPSMMEELLMREAFFQGQSRMSEGLIAYIHRYRSTPEEMARDWHYAKVMLSQWLLDGRLNFANQIQSETYPYIEEVWLVELRRVVSYFHWMVKGKQLWDQETDFQYSSVYFREQLCNPAIKSPKLAFLKIKKYLELNYLTNGRVNLNSDSVNKLIQHKAFHTWDVTHDTDSKRNWDVAATYVEQYYNNIIPAVMEDNRESIKLILQSFQVNTAPEFDAALNSFEVLIALYFLDPEILKKYFSEQINMTL
jgi:hypothetical protein